jgi:dTDP-glucose 4,6-dehydratase
MKILVTGACGFIGSSFAHLLSKNNIEYKVIDSLTYAGKQSNLPKSYDLLVKDICDVTINDVGDDYDYVVHFAAESHVDNSILNGGPFVKTNVNGTYNMIELAKQMPKLKRFVHISTDEVYGDVNDLDVESTDEKCNLHGSSYYSATKASSDLLVQAAGRTYGLPYLITRTCNNFGERQDKEKFLPTIIRKIKADEPIPVYGDGQQIREWIWADDNVEMIFNLMQHESGVWNIGSSDEWTNISIIEAIANKMGKQIKYEYVTDRKGHDRKYALNNNKIKQAGYHNITKTLDQYLNEQIQTL